MGVYSFNEKEARIRVGWEIDKIDRASSVRGGQIRLIEDGDRETDIRGADRFGRERNFFDRLAYLVRRK